MNLEILKNKRLTLTNNTINYINQLREKYNAPGWGSPIRNISVYSYVLYNSKLGFIGGDGPTELIEIETLKLLTLFFKKEMKERRITAHQAQQIINIVFGSLKDRLVEKWSKPIVLGENIYVGESLYKELREAQSEVQRGLYNIIFGEDIISFSDLEEGECLVVTSDMYNGAVVTRTDSKDAPYVIIGWTKEVETKIGDYWSQTPTNLRGKRVKTKIIIEE